VRVESKTFRRNWKNMRKLNLQGPMMTVRVAPTNLMLSVNMFIATQNRLVVGAGLSNVHVGVCVSHASKAK